MSGEMLFFLLGSFLALLTALGTIALRSPIRAVMALLAHVAVLAGLYVALHAHLLAALQLIVYAGAIVVLFVFVIMLIGPTVTSDGHARGLVGKVLGATLMLVLGITLALLMIGHQPAKLPLPACPPGAGAECGQFGGVVALANELYTGGVVPFELVSVLLLVAIIGSIAVARGRNAAEAAAISRRRKAQASTTPVETEG